MGGFGYAISNSGYLNDLWKYNIATNEWTWTKDEANNGAIFLSTSELQAGFYLLKAMCNGETCVRRLIVSK